MTQAAGVDKEKEIRRKKCMEALEEVAKVVQDVIKNLTENKRRAQCATSGSGSSSLCRKKVARYYCLILELENILCDYRNN